MTDRNLIRDFIVKTIEKKSTVPAGIDIDALNYIDDGYVDSIAIIKFVLDIENEFQIEITPEEMESDEFRTIGGLITLIERSLKER